MIGLFTNQWKLLIDILLIVGVVLLVFIWNPFGIFGNGLKLESTASMVTEVRQIGQLVTAEYYGEVIASLDETRLDLIRQDTLSAHAALVYTDMKAALLGLYRYQQEPLRERVRDYKDREEKVNNWRSKVKHDVSRSNILEKLQFLDLDTVGEFSLSAKALNGEEQSLSTKILEYQWRRLSGKDRKVKWDPKAKHLEQAMYLLYEELRSTARQGEDFLAAYVRAGFNSDANFLDFYRADFQADLSKREQKKKLAMVGRGWVKAGFDFGQLDESSFYFNEETAELHFFGLYPEVLNADINPWFIPERGIPGFDILEHNNRVNFKDAKKVKQYCIDKLEVYARRAGILDQAQRQGAETLKSFFSLITGQEVVAVHFHNDDFIRFARSIAADEHINQYEGLRIDSLFKREWALIDSLESSLLNRSKNIELAQRKRLNIKAMIGRYTQLSFADSETPFSYYSMLAYELARDSVLTSAELTQLEAMRPSALNRALQAGTLPTGYHPHTPWATDTLAFAMQYNAALAYISNHVQYYGDLDTLTLLISEAEANQQDALLTYSRVDGDRVFATFVRQPQAVTTVLLPLYYPFFYEAAYYQALVEEQRISSLSGADSQQVELPPGYLIQLTGSRLLHLQTYSADSLLAAPFVNQSALEAGQKVRAGSWLRWQQRPAALIGASIQMPVDTLPLSATQQAELETYLLQLATARDAYASKGALVKASERLRKEFTENNRFDERWSALRRKLNL